MTTTTGLMYKSSFLINFILNYLLAFFVDDSTDDTYNCYNCDDWNNWHILFPPCDLISL